MAQLNTERITAIGRNALYFDDYVLSIQYFNQVIKVKPYLAEPYLYRAIAKIQLGDFSGAEKDCSAAIANSPFLPGAYYTRGFVYRQLGEYEKAEQDFTEALIFAPENKTYLLLRADMRAQLERYDDALEDINFLLRKEPLSSSIHFEKGVILLNSKDTLNALGAFGRAVELDGANASNWSAKGLVNSMLGNDDDALYDLTQAINLGSRWAGDYINRGILYYKRHNYRGALSDYDKAVQLNPQDDHCFFNRGLLRQEVGDYNMAIEDYNRALDLNPNNTEIHYQRGVVYLQLRQWANALEDFDAMIDRYPYFLPSYYLAAQAKTSMGDSRGAYLYQHIAQQKEKEAERIKRGKVNTDVQLAANKPQERDRKKEFSNRAAQNQIEATEESEKYQSNTRGTIQTQYVDIVNEPNIVLNYYAHNQSIRRTNYFHFEVDEYNKRGVLPAPLHFTSQEIALSAELVNIHFDNIDYFSGLIDQIMDETITDADADLFFARAVEFAIVQDYRSAIEDCNKAISIRSHFPIAYFCRANWRYKLLEYQRSSGEQTTAEQLKLEFEMLLRDYDQVILQQPDFSFAYYNKANMLCAQADYQASIKYYTSAIQAEVDFAEAYFNRGLTYIFTGETEKGLQDLSKAGELGIYQAYNLISRLK